jgi:hypothetical protein
MKLHATNEWKPDHEFVRVGDTVNCKPVTGRKFRATVRRIMADDNEVVQEIEVVPLHKAEFRTFHTDRVTRLVQSKSRKGKGLSPQQLLTK